MGDKMVDKTATKQTGRGRADPKAMKRRQLPRVRGSQVCEFDGLGVLPVVHKQFLDMKLGRYEHTTKASRYSKRVEELVKAFENPRRLVAVQFDNGGPEDLGFKQWWGILEFADFEITDDGLLSFSVENRLAEWPS